jgi:hypothetical protein
MSQNNKEVLGYTISSPTPVVKCNDVSPISNTSNPIRRNTSENEDKENGDTPTSFKTKRHTIARGKKYRKVSVNVPYVLVSSPCLNISGDNATTPTKFEELKRSIKCTTYGNDPVRMEHRLNI